MHQASDEPRHQLAYRSSASARPCASDTNCRTTKTRLLYEFPLRRYWPASSCLVRLSDSKRQPIPCQAGPDLRCQRDRVIDGVDSKLPKPGASDLELHSRHGFSGVVGAAPHMRPPVESLLLHLPRLVVDAGDDGFRCTPAELEARPGSPLLVR